MGFNDFVSPKVRATIVGNVDEFSNAVVVIPWEHSQVHNGNSFLCSDVQNISSATIKWLVEIPNKDL